MVTKPLIVLDRAGAIVGVSRIDEKGLKKSIETGILWHRYPGTDRLIPFEPEGVECSKSGISTQPKLAGESGIRDEGAWVRAVVDTIIERGEDAPAVAHSDMARRETDEPESWGRVLSRLWDTVAERKRKMPEGSYTTHLFDSGPAKIRKKTGEEAIELILAESPEDVTYEAADLIYHLFVLLAEEGVDFDEVIRELDSRTR